VRLPEGFERKNPLQNLNKKIDRYKIIRNPTEVNFQKILHYLNQAGLFISKNKLAAPKVKKKSTSKIINPCGNFSE